MIQTVVRRAGVRIWRPLTELQSFSPCPAWVFPAVTVTTMSRTLFIVLKFGLIDGLCLPPLFISLAPPLFYPWGLEHQFIAEAWLWKPPHEAILDNHCRLGRVGSFPWVPISFVAFYLGSILSHFALSSLCGCPHQSFRLIVELHSTVQAYQKLHYLPGVMWALG